MDIRELPLDELVLDPNLNLRDRLDPETVDRYVEAWDRMPPITVFEVDGNWLVADGFHRHAAAVRADKRTIRAELRIGSFAEALDYVAGANLFHGLPLSRAERRRAIEIKLRLHHEKSDRRFAEELGVSRELVAKIRRNLIDAGLVPDSATRVGADGKVYPAGLPKDPNHERPSKDRPQAEREDPRDRGGRESDAAPWDDTVDPLPSAGRDAGHSFAAAAADASVPPWESGDPKDVALSPPVPVAAPTIDEMLQLMAKQVVEVVNWTQAEGFVDAYRTAGGNARGLFQTAAIKLAARADQLRKS